MLLNLWARAQQRGPGDRAWSTPHVVSDYHDRGVFNLRIAISTCKANPAKREDFSTVNDQVLKIADTVGKYEYS